MARTFNGVAGTYTLSYLYNDLSQLKEISDHWGVKVGYNYDHAGEVIGVTGQGYGGVSTYASGLVYRAFGALKQMNYREWSQSLAELQQPDVPDTVEYSGSNGGGTMPINTSASRVGG